MSIYVGLLIYLFCICLFTAGTLLLRKRRRIRIGEQKENLLATAKGIRERLAMTEFARQKRRERAEKEIYEAFSLLRNIASVEKGSEISSDAVMEQLSEIGGVLQPVYIRMLSLMRLSKHEEAEALLVRESATPMGGELAGIILRWDAMKADELTEILISHQKNIKETWITARKRQDETISDLIYMPVVLNVFVIFMNFIYVGYFIKQQELLEILF